MSTSQISSCALQYTVYGRDGGEQSASLLRYSGQRKESATGHYMLGNGYRAFNPVLMRFHRPDSMSPMGAGGLNCYAYCGGDPVNNTDPSGHMKLPQVRLQSIRPKAGFHMRNPGFKGENTVSPAVTERVVGTVNELGRNYGSQLNRIMTSADWTGPQLLLVEGATQKLISNYGENLKREAGLTVIQAAAPISSQDRLSEAIGVLVPLYEKMKLAKDTPSAISWLHDPGRMVPKVRDPGRTG
ncbi:TPA: RHS repeat-associated core domain-containing protein [Pseudomonas putida]|nr:RHS repeat-associated core domain-containing protein [Pseudomonas putida]HDS1739982.1 RHS repeat-associated core domain-containing protein [Pseudomonas putida]